MAFYLYLNTGSVNHGCEAIIRSTCDILDRTCGQKKKVLASSNAAQDKRFRLNELLDIVPAGIWDNQFQRVFYYVVRKITRNSKRGRQLQYKEFLQKIHHDDIALCVGGDTYCYTYPEYLEVCLDYIDKVGAKSVLWAASIEPSIMSERLLSHLNNYDFIIAREAITYNGLLAKGFSTKRVLKACDPAFHLPISKIVLPSGFDERNTIGLNISDLVVGEDTPKKRRAFESVRVWLQELLETFSDFNVCLIPHVYGDGADNKDDLFYTTKLFNALSGDVQPRISMVTKELSCTQLKYIISKCRFFIGARTHSMIAAYSTGVPAIALGYSVKADGIAKDLFGTTENFVLNVDDLQNPENLKVAFDYLTAHESLIRQQYKKNLPEYKNSILRAAQEIMCNAENMV